MLGALHAVCGIAALILGGCIFLLPKGTRTHVRAGWAYVISMLCLNGSALFIYNLRGRFNLFHGLALASMVTVVAGVLQARYRSRLRNWLWRHYQYMCWSYVGLVAATANEGFVRVPILRRLAASTTTALPLVVSAIIVALFAVIIYSKQNTLIRRFDRSAELQAAASSGV